MPPKKAVTPSKAPKKVAAKPGTNSKGTSTSKTRLNTTGNASKPASKFVSGAAARPAIKSNIAGGKPKGKTKDGKVQAKSSVKQWSKEDTQARIIQTAFRKHLARKKLKKLTKEKEDYEELMIKLEKEAWLHMVQREREEEEKERKKEEQGRKRRAQEIKWQKRLLEAAFDGDNEEILDVLNEALLMDKKHEGLSVSVKELQMKKHQLKLADCEDANGNTPLSEASAGGHVDTITMLLERGAEINSRGRYERTPLWRAAFAGYLNAVQVLLDNGGDPRLYANDGTNPEQVAAIPDVELILKTWNIEQTDILLTKLETSKQERLKNEQEQKEQECNRLEKELFQAEKEDKACQKLLEKAHCELNKRIFEHDKCNALGDENKIRITLQTVHDAEKELEKASHDSKTAREKLAQLKLKLRDQRKENVDKAGMDTMEVVGIKVSIKELDDVLLRDVGGKIAESGSFGKPLVLDMMAVDMFESAVSKFDEVQDGLMASIISKDILKDDRFLSLVRVGDGEEYSKTSFLGARIENFKFIILTQLWNPSEDLIQRTYPLRVMILTKTSNC